MEVRDGFIIGVFNYCDRWCERCRLTSRCQILADGVEDDFERDHGPIGEPRHERMARQISEAAERWENEHGLDFDEIQREAEKELASMSESKKDAMFNVRLEHLELETRANDFCDAVFRWIKDISDEQHRGSMPLKVLGRFWVFVGGKVHRALMGLKDAQEDELDDASDALGSAKAALLALEEMRDACDQLARDGVMPAATHDDFLRRVDWLVAALDATLPTARAFVRPGFDEPEALAQLEAQERG